MINNTFLEAHLTKEIVKKKEERKKEIKVIILFAILTY